MRHSLPILLCTNNEDYRSLIREMLGKSGYFHILEAGDEKETSELLKGHALGALTIIHYDLLSEEITNLMKKYRHFIVLSQSETEEAIVKTATLGIEHFLSFPFSSRNLMEKIEQLIQ